MNGPSSDRLKFTDWSFIIQSEEIEEMYAEYIAEKHVLEKISTLGPYLVQFWSLITWKETCVSRTAPHPLPLAYYFLKTKDKNQKSRLYNK